MKIEKVAVIGSGVMGSGIAAQIANAGVKVVMLDIVPDEASAEDRSIKARQAIETLLKTNPAPLMDKRNARLITPGNLEDDLTLLGECDWVIEVVLEDLAVKHETYETILPYCKKGAVISSNTSTIPLSQLTAPFDDEFSARFMITHFFNPPRYMRLLELVTGDKTAPEATAAIRAFCDEQLGKGVVDCHDTPGFIANRLGVFWLQAGLNEALALGLSPEEADAVMGRPAGIPKTGVFGLIDLVGIDLMPHLAGSLLSSLPEDDPYRALYRDYPLITQMIESGYTGRKGKGGFYRLHKDETGSREKQALRLDPDGFYESAYHKAQKPQLEALDAAKKGGLRGLVESPDKGGRYGWAVLSKTLAYAASLVPEIAGDIAAVDEAMRLGYNWQQGPFEMIDALGPSWFSAQLEKDGLAVPPLLAQLGEGKFYKVENGALHYFGTDGAYHKLARPAGVVLLRDLKLAAQPVLQNDSAAVWDIGEGVLCFEHKAKMNTFDDKVFALIHEVIAAIGDGQGRYKALVIYNEASLFSAGANLGLALEMIKDGQWQPVEDFIATGQRAFKALKFAPFPVVAAPSGMALGGGCEILLHADYVQAHAETYCGLVEAGVGLVPAWGGCKEMILRYRERQKQGHNQMWLAPANDPMGAVRQAFETIALAKVAGSAAEAQNIGYFRTSDGVTMNRDRLLYDARQQALKLAESYSPPEPANDICLPGASGKAALDMSVADLHKAGKATAYDVVVSAHLAAVLTGGAEADISKPVSEDDLYELERHEFMKLLRNDGTIARIEHMLATGKPLRN